MQRKVTEVKRLSTSSCQFSNILKANSVNMTTLGVNSFREAYQETRDDSFNDLTIYNQAEAAHYVYGFSLLMNLIG